VNYYSKLLMHLFSGTQQDKKGSVQSHRVIIEVRMESSLSMMSLTRLVGSNI